MYTVLGVYDTRCISDRSIHSERCIFRGQMEYDASYRFLGCGHSTAIQNDLLITLYMYLLCHTAVIVIHTDCVSPFRDCKQHAGFTDLSYQGASDLHPSADQSLVIIQSHISVPAVNLDGVYIIAYTRYSNGITVHYAHQICLTAFREYLNTLRQSICPVSDRSGGIDPAQVKSGYILIRPCIGRNLDIY